MFSNLLKKIFGTSSERYLKDIDHYVNEINNNYKKIANWTQDDLKNRTVEMIEFIDNKREEAREKAESENLESEMIDKEIYKAEQSALDELMVEAFAMVKMACKQLLGEEFMVVGNKMKWDMVPFDVQLLGAVVLHRGDIAEMKTGEGKTLVATMPIFLNALTKRGVHLVTVNDYLAERDAEWMGLIYKYLGLTIGKILNTMPNELRKDNYNCDVVYGTNNEFGFDYLRDNMAVDLDGTVQRDYCYAIVDEVDSVLIDEARTPLIISGPVKSNTNESFKKLNPIINGLVRAQQRLVSKILTDFENMDESSDAIERGTKLLIAHKGLPKNKRLMKKLQEQGMQKLLYNTESFYMQEKKIEQIEEELYYSIDEKNNIIDISDKGRYLLSPDDPNQFIIPDIGDEFAKIDEQNDLSHKEKEEKKNEIQRLHSKRSETIHNLQQLLRAYSLHEKDVDYVVKEGKVLIVDEFTGRILPGRRYSEGLHQAIEAKENVKIADQNQTLATITLQNYFRMYDKLAGMTGTAITEADEFQEIYKLEVVSITTNKPCIRDDKEDFIYKTKREKYTAIIDEILRCHKKGQPVLVGTITVDVSETISRILKRTKIPHNVLNAKQHQREAEIVLRAGNTGAVTIATNMAGRGTDIKITDEVKQLGGLKILGTERHESRRIDLQLKGRSGRQGDAGESQFFLSLEDNLMRLFGSERVSSIMDKMGIGDGEVITHSMISRSIEKAQKKVEERNFGIRKHLLEYDDVMNQQREVIYDRRNYALHGGNLQEEIDAMIDDYVNEVVMQFTDNPEIEYWNWDTLRQETISVLMTDIHLDEFENEINRELLKKKLIEKAKDTYKRKNEIIPSEIMKQLERWAYLRTIDKLWKEHLFELDQVKEGIGLQAYGQKDPLIAYKSEAFRLFKELLDRINHDSLQLMFRTEIRTEEKPKPDQNKRISIQHAASTNMGFQNNGQNNSNNSDKKKKQPYVRKNKKIGRNEPCPCGSGKKYKNCCGR